MKLKLDAEGRAVLSEGKPVYVHDDGREVAFDAAATIATISRLNGEAKAHREAKEAAEAKVKAFEGIDDPEAARKAMQTVSGLDAKRLIDAGEVDKVKAEIAKGYELKLADAEKRAAKIEGDLYAEKIGGAFARSKFISEKVAVPSDMIQATFGRNFKIEDGRIVAYGADGNAIFSRSRIGEKADFEEGLEIMVETYPHKDHILKGTGSSGSGSSGGSGGSAGGKRVFTQAEFDKMTPKDRATAMAAGAVLKD